MENTSLIFVKMVFVQLASLFFFKCLFISGGPDTFHRNGVSAQDALILEPWRKPTLSGQWTWPRLSTYTGETWKENFNFVRKRFLLGVLAPSQCCPNAGHTWTIYTWTRLSTVASRHLEMRAKRRHWCTSLNLQFFAFLFSESLYSLFVHLLYEIMRCLSMRPRLGFTPLHCHDTIEILVPLPINSKSNAATLKHLHRHATRGRQPGKPPRKFSKACLVILPRRRKYQLVAVWLMTYMLTYDLHADKMLVCVLLKLHNSKWVLELHARFLSMCGLHTVPVCHTLYWVSIVTLLYIALDVVNIAYQLPLPRKIASIRFLFSA